MKLSAVAAARLSAVLIVIAVVQFIWLNQLNHITVGQVHALKDAPYGVTLQVEPGPGMAAVNIAVQDRVSRNAEPGLWDWVALSHRQDNLGTEGTHLHRLALPVAPLSGLFTEARHYIPPIGWFVLALLVLLGSRFIASGTCIAGAGIAAGAIVWHSIAALNITGTLSTPQFVDLPLVLLAAAGGIFLGWRGVSAGGEILSRILLAAALYLVMPLLAAQFGWPTWTTYLAVPLVLVSPILAPVLVAAALALQAIYPNTWVHVSLSLVICLAIGMGLQILRDLRKNGSAKIKRVLRLIS